MSDKSKSQVQRSIKISANSLTDFIIVEAVVLELETIGDMGEGGGVAFIIIESVNEEIDEFEKERGENKGFSSFVVAVTEPAVTAAVVLL
jgi:hypothetical protein